MLAPLKPRKCSAPARHVLSALLVTRSAAAHAEDNLDPSRRKSRRARGCTAASGRAARDWTCFDRPHRRNSENPDRRGKTLLVQSGKPVGVLSRTQADAPRVLMPIGSVPHWATWSIFHELVSQRSRHVRQMTTAVGISSSKASCKAPYETFAEMAVGTFAQTHSQAMDAHGRPRGMGGRAAPGLHHGGFQHARVESAKPHRHSCNRRLGRASALRRRALALFDTATRKAKPISLRCRNIVDVLRFVGRGIRPDAVTRGRGGSNSRTRPGQRYLPQG